VSVIAMGAAFNLVNAAFNGYWLFFLADYPASCSRNALRRRGPVLRGLRGHRWSTPSCARCASRGDRLLIPAAGRGSWCPAPYLGEIMEWCGFALASWSLAGVAFAAWTVANLAPRARTNHQWYRAQFQDYPAGRKALLPFVW
jgi:hypothetical protein